jgi:hypothetical protein
VLVAAAVGAFSRGFSAAALPQYADDDELASKAGKALEEITAAGTLKVERQITTPQAATVGELTSILQQLGQLTLSMSNASRFSTRMVVR